MKKEVGIIIQIFISTISFLHLNITLPLQKWVGEQDLGPFYF